MSDLLENNTFEHIPAKRREQIKTALKGYKSLSGSLRGLFESMGFAKTSSDNRVGMNMDGIADR